MPNSDAWSCCLVDMLQLLMPVCTTQLQVAAVKR